MERVWNSPRTSKSSLSSNLSSLTNECTWVPVSYTKVITEGRGLQSSIFVLRVKEDRRESTSVVSILPLTSCCHRQERSTPPPRLCVGLHPLFWGTASSPQPSKRWINPFIPQPCLWPSSAPTKKLNLQHFRLWPHDIPKSGCLPHLLSIPDTFVPSETQNPSSPASPLFAGPSLNAPSPFCYFWLRGESMLLSSS